MIRGSLHRLCYLSVMRSHEAFTRIQHVMDLPQIVVVGSQSVGKSSLIESMSGVSPFSVRQSMSELSEF